MRLGLVIEKKRLWIELRRKGDHLPFIKGMRIANKALPHVEVVQMETPVGVIPDRVHHDYSGIGFAAFLIPSR